MSTDENTFKKVEWTGDQWDPSDDDDTDGLPLRPHGAGIAEADLELLTLAARAIGAVQVEVVEGEAWVNLHFDNGPPVYSWNPLLHGDDTFNLATDTHMQITQRVDEVRIGHRSLPALYEPVGEDRRSATRRAVTRAAAEIGKQRS
jgi:hypothetical protein